MVFLFSTNSTNHSLRTSLLISILHLPICLSNCQAKEVHYGVRAHLSVDADECMDV
jgi:hypothetical protein